MTDDLRAPAERCGDLTPALEGSGWLECVLRPGHQGSHADHGHTRWTEKPHTCSNCDGIDPASCLVAPKGADLRDRLAAAIGALLDASPYWLPADGRPALVDAAHAVAEAAIDTEKRSSLPFLDRIGYAREWARRTLPEDQQHALFRILRGDTPTLDRTPWPRTEPDREEAEYVSPTKAPLLEQLRTAQAALAAEVEVSRAVLKQRQEMAAERYAWQERGDAAEQRAEKAEAALAAVREACEAMDRKANDLARESTARTDDTLLTLGVGYGEAARTIAAAAGWALAADRPAEEPRP